MIGRQDYGSRLLSILAEINFSMWFREKPRLVTIEPTIDIQPNRRHQRAESLTKCITTLHPNYSLYDQIMHILSFSLSINDVEYMHVPYMYIFLP